jgi:hypothetical protein
MPILNLNGTERKHGIATGKTISGAIFTPGLAAIQHPVIGFRGRTYSSPFTASDKPLFNNTRTVSTQPALPPLKNQGSGKVVMTHDFVKIHPNEKGKTFSTTARVRPVAFRAGGPSKHTDTPANPNAPRLRFMSRPQHVMGELAPEKKTNLSFLRSGGTIGGHVDPQAGTSSGTSRWRVADKGVVVA